MHHGIKMMLLGIFLAAASCWCLLLHGSSTSFDLFAAAGAVILPLAAIICFIAGFATDRPKEPNEYPDVPQDEEDKE